MTGEFHVRQFVFRGVMWVNYHQDKSADGCEPNPWMF